MKFNMVEMLGIEAYSFSTGFVSYSPTAPCDILNLFDSQTRAKQLARSSPQTEKAR